MFHGSPWCVAIHLTVGKLSDKSLQELLLEGQYWIHGIFPNAQIIAIISSTDHGRHIDTHLDIGFLMTWTHDQVDQSTLSTSTASYSADKCNEFINMIENFTGILGVQRGLGPQHIMRLEPGYRLVPGYSREDQLRVC